LRIEKLTRAFVLTPFEPLGYTSVTLNNQFNAQLLLARDRTVLYKITKQWVATSQDGKRGYYRNSRLKLVNSQFEIEQYLEAKLVGG